MGWPQITWLALICVSAGITAAQHGQIARISFFRSATATAIVTYLLYAGGFFHQS